MNDLKLERPPKPPSAPIATRPGGFWHGAIRDQDTAVYVIRHEKVQRATIATSPD